MSNERDNLVTYLDQTTPMKSPFQGFHEFSVKAQVQQQQPNVTRVDAIVRYTYGDGKVEYRGYNAGAGDENDFQTTRVVQGGGPSNDRLYGDFNKLALGLYAEEENAPFLIGNVIDGEVK